MLAVDGEPITFASQLKEAIAKRPEQQIIDDDSPQRIADDDSRRRRRDGRAAGLLGIGIADETVSIKPGASKPFG